MIISIIFAFARDKQERMVIGKDNKLPWYSPTDLRRFRDYTLYHPIIMGRKTFESIGKVLPKRENIIITRNKDYQIPGAYVENDLQSALVKAATFSYPEVFIIGGAEVYTQAFPLSDRLYITEIKRVDVEGDSFFPDFNFLGFRKIYGEEDENESFAVYQRKFGKTVVISSEEEPVRYGTQL